MKKLFILFSILILYTSISWGQTTIVSGTIIDNSGQTWSNALVTATFNPNPNNTQGPYYLNGVQLTTAQRNPGSVSSNLSGVFTLILSDNSQISPSGSTWNFNICSQTSAPCSSITLKITGATQNITTNITAGITPPNINASPITKAYSDAELSPIPASLSAMYYNTTTLTYRGWNGAVWTSLGSGSGGGGSLNPVVAFTAQTSVTMPYAIYQFTSTGIISACYDVNGNLLLGNAPYFTMAGTNAYNYNFSFAIPESGTCTANAVSSGSGGLPNQTLNYFYKGNGGSIPVISSVYDNGINVYFGEPVIENNGITVLSGLNVDNITASNNITTPNLTGTNINANTITATGTISASQFNGALSGQVTGGVYSNGTGTNYMSGLAQGMVFRGSSMLPYGNVSAIGWDATGNGEADYYDQSGSGPGGFLWAQSTYSNNTPDYLHPFMYLYPTYPNVGGNLDSLNQVTANYFKGQLQGSIQNAKVSRADITVTSCALTNSTYEAYCTSSFTFSSLAGTGYIPNCTMQNSAVAGTSAINFSITSITGYTVNYTLFSMLPTLDAGRTVILYCEAFNL